MNSPRILLRRSAFALFLVAGSAAALAWPARTPANDAIEQAMDQMNASLKVLGKGITAETRTTALDELVKFEQAVIAAKGQTPDSATGVDEKKRPAFVSEFRATLCEALKLACDAEIATVNGKYKEADGIVKGKLDSLKSAGHGKFKKDDEKGGPGK